MDKIRVLVVDDSFFMRKAITKILNVDDIEVVGIAENGREAIQKNKDLQPDVITLDIEMPEMNGLEALEFIQKDRKVPVLMLSTLTEQGADTTIKALSLGAVDFITKNTKFTEVNSMKDELLTKIRALKSNSFSKNLLARREKLKSNQELAEELPAQETKLREFKDNFDFSKIRIICIGISTGGPAALQQLIPKISSRIPVPIVIVQHMPPKFTKSLADRLNLMSSLEVKEAQDRDNLLRGTVYLAPGGKQLVFTNAKEIRITDKPENQLFKPSVNVTVGTANSIYKNKLMGIMMTGMGNDGAIAFEQLSKNGGYIICQSPESCVVAGMSNAVISKGIANKILHIDKLASTLNSIFNV